MENQVFFHSRNKCNIITGKKQTNKTFQNKAIWLSMVAQACNPNYSESCNPGKKLVRSLSSDNDEEGKS
jgi:hypothetical protein